jgi:hypothetical protein
MQDSTKARLSIWMLQSPREESQMIAAGRDGYGGTQCMVRKHFADAVTDRDILVRH